MCVTERETERQRDRETERESDFVKDNEIDWGKKERKVSEKKYERQNKKIT